MDKEKTLRKTKLFLFDQDGTLYLGDRLYDFTIPMLEKTGLRSKDELRTVFRSSGS